jgi:hypothetical protein
MKVAEVTDCCPISGVIPSSILERLTELISRIQMRILEAQSGQTENYEIAGLPVCFRFLDKRIKEQVSPAFLHLRTERQIQPELTIVLDGVSSPFDSRRRLLDWAGWGEMDIWVVRVAEMVLIVQSEGQVIVAFDDLRRTGYWCEPGATGMNYLDRAAPMCSLLTYWFARRGRYLFHGASIGDSDTGVLILGAGGAGKSTTALACLEAGMTYAGDDYCLLRMNGGPFVDSLFGTAKLSDRSRFPSLAAAMDLEGITSDEKTVYCLHRLPKSSLRFGFRLRSILLARVEPIQETTTSLSSHAKGFLALAPSIGFQLPEMRKDAMRCFDAVARQLPVYDLKLGADMRSTPEAIRRLLRELC